MPWQCSIKIEIVTFDKAAIDQVLAIKLKDYGYKGSFTHFEGQGTIISSLDDDGMLMEDGNARKLMNKLKKALGDNGIAEIIFEDTYDVPCCEVYYYLGDKVHKVVFDYERTRDYSDQDFSPNLGWEKKKKAVFTEKEKEMLLKYKEDVAVLRSDSKENAKELYRMEMENILSSGITIEERLEKDRIRATANSRINKDAIQLVLSKRDKDAKITFQDKHFVLTGFGDNEEMIIQEIEKRGGIVHSSMVKIADYLVFSLNDLGFGKPTKAMEWREKGQHNEIVSEYQLWEAFAGN